MAPIVNEINELKKALNAVILAHSYVNPEIIHTVADYVEVLPLVKKPLVLVEIIYFQQSSLWLKRLKF